MRSGAWSWWCARAAGMTSRPPTCGVCAAGCAPGSIPPPRTRIQRFEPSQSALPLREPQALPVSSPDPLMFSGWGRLGPAEMPMGAVPAGVRRWFGPDRSTGTRWRSIGHDRTVRPQPGDDESSARFMSLEDCSSSLRARRCFDGSDQDRPRHLARTHLDVWHRSPFQDRSYRVMSAGTRWHPECAQDILARS